MTTLTLICRDGRGFTSRRFRCRSCSRSSASCSLDLAARRSFFSSRSFDRSLSFLSFFSFFSLLAARSCGSDRSRCGAARASSPEGENWTLPVAVRSAESSNALRSSTVLARRAMARSPDLSAMGDASGGRAVTTWRRTPGNALSAAIACGRDGRRVPVRGRKLPGSSLFGLVIGPFGFKSKLARR